MKKFRFPKGISQVNFPAMPPLEMQEIAQREIRRQLAQFSSIPMKSAVRFEYRYVNGRGIMEVQVYKYLPPSPTS